MRREGAYGARSPTMKRVIELMILTLAALLILFVPALGEEQTADPSPPAAEESPAPTEAPEPKIRFTRDFSASYAEYGNQVTISYTVRNEGSVPVENIVITDDLIGEVGRIEYLDAGERKTMSARVRITETCTSTPGISYECGGRSYSEQRSSQRIYLAEVRVQVELSADNNNVAPGEMVTLRLKVVNEGNVNLYGLRAEEPVLGDLGSIVSTLPPGGECVVTRTVQMKSANNFQFSIAGSSDTGGSFSVQSNELSVLVTPVAAQILLSLRAEADRTELTGPGEVSFSLYVSNDCSLELRNVVLSEETGGKIRELLFVPTGEMPAITETRLVEQSGVYRFMAQVTDSVGDTLTVYSDPIEITVAEQSAEPSEQPAETAPAESPENAIPVLDGSPYRMGEEPATFEKLMLGSAVAVLLVLIIWYLAETVRQMLRERRRRARRRKQKKKKRTKGKK